MWTGFFQGLYLNWPSLQDEKSESDLHYLYQHQNLLQAQGEISGHQVVGKTHGCQHDYEIVQEQCQLASNGIYLGGGGGPVFDKIKADQVRSGIRDWRLLLELRSDENAGLEWIAYGTLYFWIREEDLCNCEFSNVWALFQCLRRRNLKRSRKKKSYDRSPEALCRDFPMQGLQTQ